VDQKLIVRDIDGHALGLGNSARNIEHVKTEIRNFTDAIKRLTILRNTRGATQFSPEFHAAVGALSATTPGGKTDINTHHEEQTLKRFGLVSNGAIEEQIRDIEGRLQQQKDQLNPLPEGYTDAKTPAASGGGKVPEGARVGTKDGVRGYKLPGQPFVPL
jgi:hypothetical protein